MNRNLILILAVSLLLPAGSLAQTELDMTVDPTALSWTPVVAGSPTMVLTPGILSIESPVNSFSGYLAPSPWWPAAATNPGGFEIEAELRVISQPSTNNPSQGAVQVIGSTGSHKVFLDIFTDHIALAYETYSGTTSYGMDTTDDFHVYHIHMVGTAIMVEVDGVLRLSANVLSTSTQQRLDFGDLLYANHTVSEWRYVAFGPTGVVPNAETEWSTVKSLYR